MSEHHDVDLVTADVGEAEDFRPNGAAELPDHLDGGDRKARTSFLVLEEAPRSSPRQAIPLSLPSVTLPQRRSSLMSSWSRERNDVA